MQPELAISAEEFCRAEPALGSPRGSFSKCRSASFRLVRHLTEAGFEASGLRLSECSGRYPDADPRWRKEVGGEFWWIHYAVLVGETVCDVTMRQFAPESPFPALLPLGDILALWGEVTVVDLKTGKPLSG